MSVVLEGGDHQIMVAQCRRQVLFIIPKLLLEFQQLTFSFRLRGSQLVVALPSYPTSILSPRVIDIETWFSRFGVGRQAATSPRNTSHGSKSEKKNQDPTSG